MYHNWHCPLGVGVGPEDVPCAGFQRNLTAPRPVLGRHGCNWSVAGVGRGSPKGSSQGFEQGDMLLSVGATSSLVAQHGMTQSAPWLFSKTSSPAPPFLRQNSSVSSGESVILVAIWIRSFVFWPVQRSGLPDFIFRPLINIPDQQVALQSSRLFLENVLWAQHASALSSGSFFNANSEEMQHVEKEEALVRAICNVFDSESESEDSVDTLGPSQASKRRRCCSQVGLQCHGADLNLVSLNVIVRLLSKRLSGLNECSK